MSTRPVSGSKPPAGGPPPEPAPPGPVARARVSRDGVDLEVAAGKGRVADGIELEVLSASAKLTADQITVQGVVSRIEVGNADKSLAASVEKLGFKVNSSRTNPDGSVGGNASIGATLIGVEGTAGHSGYSVTGGLSVGVGAELGVGVRDFDKDNSPELCARVSLAFFTLGACLENPF